jgi:hypothetical protein
MRKRIITGGVVAFLVVLWIFWGRYAVEGGKAPWAIINDRNDVLKAALPSASQSQKEDAMWRAVHKNNADAIRLVAAAGIDPNKVKIGQNCLIDYPGNRFSVQKALIESGADPRVCGHYRDGKQFIADFISREAGGASEPELLAVVQFLVKKGLPIDPNAIASAEKLKLDQIAAYLRNPSGTVEVAKGQTLALRGGDDHVDRDDLKAVCRGKGVDALPPYKKEPGAVSPAYAFETRTEEPRDASSFLPRWWIADRLQHTQVVACARVLDKKSVKECKYQGGAVVTYYDAMYQLSVREAKTANEITSKEVALTINAPTECLMFKMGGSEGTYPDVGPELTSLLKSVIGAE